MAEESKRTPAYVSYKTFKTSIMGLEHVPHVIDYSVYQSMNGSTRNFLFGAFRFFELIDAKGAPTSRFKAMASSDEAAWKKNMAELIRTYYKPQLEALQGGSIASLKSSFGDDIGASVVSPACRFLISAAKDVGLDVSPSVAKATVGNPPRKKKIKGTPRSGEDEGGGGGDDDGGDTSTGATIAFPIPIAGKAAGRIVVPKDLDESDLAMFNAMVAAVVAYAKQGAGGGDE